MHECPQFLVMLLCIWVGVQGRAEPQGEQLVVSSGASKSDLARYFRRLDRNVQGYPEYQHRQTGIVFVWLPGGKFWMGSPNGAKGNEEETKANHESEQPLHSVPLNSFLIAKYEITQGDWKRVMSNTPSKFVGDKLPVEQVSWLDCQEFCRKTRLALPTEAQWEYACRAGSRGDFGGTGILDEMGWYRKNSEIRTHVVGKKTPNGFGLHDMHGNVWEWCEDIHDRGFYSDPKAVEIDPVCRSGSHQRVVRGGSFGYTRGDSRSAFRLGRFRPTVRSVFVGFRPVFNPTRR